MKSFESEGLPCSLTGRPPKSESGITRCFWEDAGDDQLRGSVDNAATNTAILSLMLADAHPDSFLVAFTGDEEVNSPIGSLAPLAFSRAIADGACYNHARQPHRHLP